VATVFTRDSIYAIARICYRPTVRPSICMSVTRVYHRKMKKASVMISSPPGSPMILVFWRQI